MKKVRNEKAYKQTITVRQGDGPRANILRVNLAPGLNRVDDDDWAAVMENERAREYAEALRDEGVIDYDDDGDAPKKKTSKAKSKKAKGKKGKKSSDIEGL